ncbi:MAG: hypothetical protein KGL72_01560 [Actinomycetales bacterium]|nr:hypothetical protein [Actinomycetales bacterium]
MNQIAAPAKFAVDPFKLHIVGTVLLTSIAAIEASHLARAGRPVTMALGITLLTPIAEDIKQLAVSCFASAGNYESAEALLTPEFVKQFSSIEPQLARAVAAAGYFADRLIGGGETPVVATAVGSASVAAVASLSGLVGRLQRASVSQQILVENSAGPAGRQFTIYLPGTQDWAPVGSTKAFDLASDLAAFARPGVSAPERAAVQALSAKGFGTKPGDSLTLVGYSEGGIVGANLIASGAVTHLGGRVSGLVAVASPISAAQLPADTKVISLEHTDDLVPKLDLAEHKNTANWTTVKLNPSGLDTHYLHSYQESLSQLSPSEHSKLNEALANMRGGRLSGSAARTSFEAVRVKN